jgi:putative PEP-CTERM system TPR-repeat lipoprotein
MRMLAKILLTAGFAAVVSTPVPAADSKASRYYEDALARYERNDLPGAIIQLKNVLQADQKMLAAHVLLGKALLNSGDPVGAEVEFDEALRQGVSRAEVITLLGQSYLLQGKYETLLERITPSGLPLGLQVDVLVLRANAQAENGNLVVAMRTLDEARALDPRSVSVRVTQAMILIRNGDLARANALTDEALALAPNDATVWNTRASLLHLKGDVGGALSAYAKASTLNPKYLDPRIARAGLLVDMGRMKEADHELEEVKIIEPSEPRAAYLRAVIAASRGDPAAAKESLAEVTALLDPVPASVLALNRQMLLLNALAHYELGDREKAEDKLKIYLRRYPGEPAPTKLLASLYLDAGNHAGAVLLLEPLRRASPNDPRTLSLLATAYMQERNYRGASELLEQAVRTSGGAADIRTDLGISLAGAGKGELALDQLRQAFAKDPKQARAGLALTTLYLRSGQPKRALEVMEAVTKSDPTNLTALNMLGIVRVAAGDRAGGRKAYEQVLARDPGYQAATLNLARLDAAEGKADAARQRLSQLIKADDKNIEAMMELAALEEKAGKTDAAARWLDKARFQPKGALRAGVLLTELYLRTGNLEQALTVAKETLVRAPEDLSVLALVTRVQLARGNNSGARQTLADMTRYASYDPAAQFEVARLQVAAGNDSGAVYSLDKALGTQPDFLPALVLHTEIDIRQRDFVKVETRIKLIGDKYPASGVALRLQGDLALAKGQHAAALASYANAIKKDNSADMALRLFRAHVGAGDLGKGVLFLEKWHRDHPDNIPVLRTIGDSDLRLGNLNAARAAYEKLLKLQPDDALVLNNLAQAAQAQNDKAAVGFADRAYNLRPNDPVVIDTLGWIMVRQGQLDRGLALLRDARLRDSANPEIRYHLAAALAKSGRKAEARDELAQALKGDSPFEGVEEARRLQNELGK